MTVFCRDCSRTETWRRAVAEAGRGLPGIEPGMPIPAGTGLTRRDFVSRTAGLALGIYGGAALSAEALEAGIAQIRPGGRLSDIGAAVEQVARGAGFEVVREYVGHGIGRNLHEEPQIPNYGKPGRGPLLKPGLVVAEKT